MKKYLGVKIIEAEPMSEASFINNVKNEDVPQNCLRREGYKVVYEDGYVSWSPKDVFEKSYKEVGVLADEKEEMGILVNPNTGYWRVVGNVASIEL